MEISDITKKVLGYDIKKEKIKKLSRFGLIFFIIIIASCIFTLVYLFDHPENISFSEEHNFFNEDLTSKELWYHKKLAALHEKKSDSLELNSENLYPDSLVGSHSDDQESNILDENIETEKTQETEKNKLEENITLNMKDIITQAKESPLTKVFIKTKENKIALNSVEEKNLDDGVLQADSNIKNDLSFHKSSINTEITSTSLKLNAGTIIPSILISGINSDLPGFALAQVRQNIYDTVSTGNVLIPVGAKIILKYEHEVLYGQKRILVSATRLIFPNGESFALEQMPVSDISGMSGFYDQVNSHYAKIFSSALALGVISAGLQLGQPKPDHNFQSPSSGQMMAGALSQNFGEVASQTIHKNLDVQPTLSVRPGYLFNIILIQDVILNHSN